MTANNICEDRNSFKVHGNTLKFLFFYNSPYVKFLFCLNFIYATRTMEYVYFSTLNSLLCILKFCFPQISSAVYFTKSCNSLTIPAPNLFCTACQSHHLPRYFIAHKSSLSHLLLINRSYRLFLVHLNNFPENILLSHF